MEYFKDIDKIKYLGKESKEKFTFRHYNPEEIADGKTMKEQLRFSLAYWHTMTQDGSDPFGSPTNERNWVGKTEMDTAKEKVEAFFELLQKLDVEYFAFHDVDIAPEGNSLEEFQENLDIITDIMKNKMDETGIKLLWNTSNLFSAKKYVKGAATSSDANVYAYAAAQVKKSLELSKKLNGENFVFWGGREGYESLLNTDMEFEQDNMAYLFKLAKQYADELEHDVQFLLEPKPKEPMTHQYDYDAATTLEFLRKYDLENVFKLNLEANHATLAGHTFEHEIHVARINNALGSIDANQGDPLLGWDVDEFPTDLYGTTLAMYELVKAGGIAPGGINFDAKVRRSSFEMEDLVLAHIAGMDSFARGYKSALKMKEANFLEDVITKRYQSFNSEIGKKITGQKTSLSELADYAKNNQDIKLNSDNLEYIKSRLNDFIF